MRAIEGLLKDFIDYAGLFPPAALDMHSAVREYLESGGGASARALGRFVVDLDRFPYLWDAAGDYVRGIRLSLLCAPDSDWDEQQRLVDKGFLVEAIEIRGARPEEIGRLAMQIPAGIHTYFEVPIDAAPATLDAIATAGARVKLRTGGLSREAFPSVSGLAQMLAELAARRLLFKATAGLHHALRGRHPLGCGADASTAVMHGFMNLATAAALLYFGGDAKEARLVLEEEWPGAWRITPEAVFWGVNSWNGDELREVRQQFFAGFGACSFQEPMRELEALQWL